MIRIDSGKPQALSSHKCRGSDGGQLPRQSSGMASICDKSVQGAAKIAMSRAASRAMIAPNRSKPGELRNRQTVFALPATALSKALTT